MKKRSKPFRLLPQDFTQYCALCDEEMRTDEWACFAEDELVHDECADDTYGQRPPDMKPFTFNPVGV